MSSRAKLRSAGAFADLAPGGETAACLDAIGLSIVVAARDGTILHRNAKARKRLPVGDALPMVLEADSLPDRFEGWQASLARVLDDGETIRLPCVFQDAVTGTLVLASLQCTAIHRGDDTQANTVMVTVEETTLPAGDPNHVEVSQRLASLGKLAARVAHELNNPLDGILRYINLAMRIVEDESEPRLKNYLMESRTGLMRMVQIISDLLEYSRTTGGQFDDMSINDVVEQAIRSSTAAAEANNVVIAADFQSRNMPAVRGGRLLQVVTNLIGNAIDAMPNGGRLQVTVGLHEGDVVIRVADTGVGLPTDADKVFTPFYTTKAPGKGSGLGLAICKDFVADMNGTITAVPAEPKGAVFTVRIPATSCQPSSAFTMQADAPSH